MEGQGEHNADSHMGKPYTTGHELLFRALYTYTLLHS